MTGPVNLHDVALAGEPAPTRPATATGRPQVGPAIGGEHLGASIYEIDPGESVNPYHYEGVEEEWALVLTGSPTLRDPDGEHQLVAGDVVASAPVRVVRTSSRTARIRSRGS